MLNVAGQGLIGGFWKLASYGIGSRSQRKHRGILVWQSLAVLYSSIFDQGATYSLLKDLTICIGLWWPHFCRLKILGSRIILRRGGHMCSAVSVK